MAASRNVLGSASRDGTAKLWHWDPDQRKLSETHELRGHSGDVLGLAFSPDGKTLASSSADYTVRLWHVETGIACGTLREPTNDVWCVAFSPDGKTLVSGSIDVVRFWRGANEDEVDVLRMKQKSEGINE